MTTPTQPDDAVNRAQDLVEDGAHGEEHAIPASAQDPAAPGDDTTGDLGGDEARAGEQAAQAERPVSGDAGAYLG